MLAAPDFSVCAVRLQRARVFFHYRGLQTRQCVAQLIEKEDEYLRDDIRPTLGAKLF